MGLALAVGIAGYVLTSLNYTGEIPANLLTQVGVLVAIAIIAEVGVHFLAPYADPVFLRMPVCTPCSQTLPRSTCPSPSR